MRAAAAALAGAAALIGCGGDDTETVRVPSEAMAPTYAIGDELEIDRDAYAERDPRRGDVVLFRAPIGLETGACGVERRRTQPCPRPTRASRRLRLVMRVVAVPGDRVAFRAGTALVNGMSESREVDVSDPLCDYCELPVEATVPRGHFFVAGDNRSAASDSREFGPVPLRSIEAKVQN